MGFLLSFARFELERRIDKKERCFFIDTLLFMKNVILFNSKSGCFYQ